MKDNSDFPDPFKKPASQGTSVPVAKIVDNQQRQRCLLKETVEKFIDDKTSSNAWTAKTCTIYKGHLHLLCEHFGEKYDLSKMTRDNFIDFRNRILKKTACTP